MANSKAPVSEAGTIPILKSLGIRRTFRVKSIAFCNFCFPIVDLCERPNEAPERDLSVQVGGFVHGPDEKWGLLGFEAGFFKVIFIILTDMCPSLGRGVPRSPLSTVLDFNKNKVTL